MEAYRHGATTDSGCQEKRLLSKYGHLSSSREVNEDALFRLDANVVIFVFNPLSQFDRTLIQVVYIYILVVFISSLLRF